MNQKKYVNTIIRKLQCSGSRKKEIRRELESNIGSALEQGETWEQIKTRMGTSAAVAAEFNANFSEKERKAARKNRRIKIVAIIAIILIVLAALIWWFLPKSYSLGEHGNFDGQAVINKAEEAVELLNADDFEGLKAMSTDKLKESMSKETLDAARQQLGGDWGSFQSFGSVYSSEIDQLGSWYAVVQLVAVYENRSITYTISFNEDMELSGFYMK